jgi:hypothetical protein
MWAKPGQENGKEIPLHCKDRKPGEWFGPLCKIPCEQPVEVYRVPGQGIPGLALVQCVFTEKRGEIGQFYKIPASCPKMGRGLMRGLGILWEIWYFGNMKK